MRCPDGYKEVEGGCAPEYDTLISLYLGAQNEINRLREVIEDLQKLKQQHLSKIKYLEDALEEETANKYVAGIDNENAV